MRLSKPMAVLVLIASPVIAQTRPSAGQIEPDARLWQTWVLAYASDQRPAAPPDRAESKRELLLVREATANPDAAAAQQLAYWNAGSPNYRWQQIAMANTGL